MTDADSASVSASISSLPSGGSLYTYDYPDGSVEQVPAPPSTFNPLTADAATLAEYDFPPKPTDPSKLADWTSAMEAYKPSNTQPATTVPANASLLHAPSCNNESSGYLCGWGGYFAGTWNSTTTNYVGVDGKYPAPTIADSSCTTAGGVSLYQLAWVGLGGTRPSDSDDLVQEGIGWCINNVSSTVWSPFLEFADTDAVSLFCGQANWLTWTIPYGDDVYDVLGYSQSTSEANFYIEDETTGTAYSCARTDPSGWDFDGNTAEWISESEQFASNNNGLSKYDAFSFSDDIAELNSTGAWVTLGSQTNTAITTGCSATQYSQSPGAIGADNKSFQMTWNAYRYSCTM